MPLKIAFIGYNCRLTMENLRQLVRDNISQVKFYNAVIGHVVLNDGTTIDAILRPPFLDGTRYDQIIIADDRRGEVYCSRRDDLAWLRFATAGSVIAEEFRIQHYDLDAEEAET